VIWREKLNQYTLLLILNKMRVPLQIRSHLIPFLYKEMEGSMTDYFTQKTLSIKICKHSSIGKYLYSQLSEINKKQEYTIELNLEKKTITTYSGYIYKVANNEKEKIIIQDDKALQINSLLEDIFRIAFVYYIDGYKEHSNLKCIRLAIDKFIDKYQLLEVGLTNEGLRSMYYRNTKNKLKRLQKRIGNQVPSFCI